MSIKASEVYRITENSHGRYVYFTVFNTLLLPCFRILLMVVLKLISNLTLKLLWNLT
jgi:hypothetical protein